MPNPDVSGFYFQENPEGKRHEISLGDTMRLMGNQPAPGFPFNHTGSHQEVDVMVSIAEQAVQAVKGLGVLPADLAALSFFLVKHHEVVSVFLSVARKAAELLPPGTLRVETKDDPEFPEIMFVHKMKNYDHSIQDIFEKILVPANDPTQRVLFFVAPEFEP